MFCYKNRAGSDTNNAIQILKRNLLNFGLPQSGAPDYGTGREHWKVPVLNSE